jgi:uncharacterized membrane protein
MGNVREVHVTDPRHSHWKTRGPLWTSAEWDAEITEDRPGRVIAWRSIEGGGNVRAEGRVDFTEAGGSTMLHVEVEYESPGGAIGDFVSKLFANPEHQVEEDLIRFKEGVERGQQFEATPPDPSRRRAPNRGHGTPGGSLGSLNEDENLAQDRTSEKSDDRPL